MWFIRWCSTRLTRYYRTDIQEQLRAEWPAFISHHARGERADAETPQTMSSINFTVGAERHARAENQRDPLHPEATSVQIIAKHTPYTRNTTTDMRKWINGAHAVYWNTETFIEMHRKWHFLMREYWDNSSCKIQQIGSNRCFSWMMWRNAQKPMMGMHSLQPLHILHMLHILWNCFKCALFNSFLAIDRTVKNGDLFKTWVCVV